MNDLNHAAVVFASYIGTIYVMEESVEADISLWYTTAVAVQPHCLLSLRAEGRQVLRMGEYFCIVGGLLTRSCGSRWLWTVRGVVGFVFV